MSRRHYRVTIEYYIEAETIEKGKLSVAGILEMLGIKRFDVKHISESRTENQNRALHMWCDQVAEEAQSKGLTVDALILKPAEFPITKHIVKDFIREVGRIMFKKDSTSKLDKDEFTQIVEVCKREFAQRIDCSIPFPSIESQMERDNY